MMSEIPQLKTIKLSLDEQNFIKDYRRLEELEREKEIKFFQCPGDAPITKSKTDRIIQKRDQIVNERAENLRMRDVTRFKLGQVQESDDPLFMNKVVVPVSQELEQKPNWDEF